MTTLHNLLLLSGKPKSNFKDTKQMVISNGDQKAYWQEKMGLWEPFLPTFP